MYLNRYHSREAQGKGNLVRVNFFMAGFIAGVVFAIIITVISRGAALAPFVPLPHAGRLQTSGLQYSKFRIQNSEFRIKDNEFSSPSSERQDSRLLSAALPNLNKKTLKNGQDCPLIVAVLPMLNNQGPPEARHGQAELNNVEARQGLPEARKQNLRQQGRCTDTPAAVPAILATENTEGTENDWLGKLLEKIRFVESGNRKDVADGDGGLAGGPLQLHPCIVDDVNFYYEMDFTYQDRYNLAKARQLARLYITFWMQRNREEIAARIFNGGPSGWKKASTESYWEKINNVK